MKPLRSGEEAMSTVIGYARISTLDQSLNFQVGEHKAVGYKKIFNVQNKRSQSRESGPGECLKRLG